MKTILIDIPEQKVFFMLDADQWYALETWLTEKGIPFSKQSPKQKLPISINETLISYRIDQNTQDVINYFGEKEIDSNSSAS